MQILSFIIDSIFPPRETELLVRNVYGTGTKNSTLVLEPVYGGTSDCPVLSLLRYEDMMVQACIQEAKFHGSKDAAKVLGTVLHEFLFEYLSETALDAVTPALRPVLIPLPLSHARFRERGYNQTMRIVEAACEGLNVEIDEDLLVRVRNTAPQTNCSGIERRTNMKDAFAVTTSCDPLRTYIVVDDVITTGNTMLAAAEALRAGGAARLLPLTLAY
jgi:ComF family protein